MPTNRETIEAYVAAFNCGDIEALKALFTPDAQVQGVLGAVPISQALAIWKQLHESFAVQLTIEAVVEEGESVAVRYVERGTFRAPFRGAEPTGKSYELGAIEWFELRNGLIAARWGARDSASQARQIGLPL